MYSNKENINILTSLLCRFGVDHVVVCPGSRNAPLVHNFSECPGITCHPATDERSAGFMALGLGQQLHHPVAVCVTSGSALLNVLPAAAEATYQHCGIIVISADRPAAWIDQLDGQTLPQHGALGRFVATSVSLPEPHDREEHWHCNRLVNEALIAALLPARPSVHINVPVSEPLFEFTQETLPDERMVHSGLWSDLSFRELILHAISEAERPLFVIGQTQPLALSERDVRELAHHFVVLSDPLSPYHTPFRLSHFSLQPSLVVYLGGHTVNKQLRLFLRSLPEDTTHVLVSDDMELHDVSQHTDFLVLGSMAEVVCEVNRNSSHSSNSGAFYNSWQHSSRVFREKLDSLQPHFSQALAVKVFEEQLNASPLALSSPIVYYANSMAVRLADVYAQHYCYCNRGLNGIEGSLSVAAGASLATEERVYCVIGDLSFFYDENALWQQELRGNFRILLLNNSQGGIFRTLSGLEKSPVRDSLVSGRHNTSAEGISRQFHVCYLKATDEASLREGIRSLLCLESSRPVLLEVMTQPDIDQQEYANQLNP